MTRLPSLFTQKCMQKNEVVKLSSENWKDNGFCDTAQYFYINYPKQLILAPSWKTFFQFQKMLFRYIWEIQTRPTIGMIPLNGSPDDVALDLDFQKETFFVACDYSFSKNFCNFLFR